MNLEIRKANRIKSTYDTFRALSPLSGFRTVGMHLSEVEGVEHIGLEWLTWLVAVSAV